MSSTGNESTQGDVGMFAPIHNRGHAVFINNIVPKGNDGKFEFPARVGGNEDSTNLQTLFINTLGFKWINNDCYENVTTQEWDHNKTGTAPGVNVNCPCIRCRIRYTDHSQSECFVLAISSHGREITETEIIFSDGNSIFLTEILEALCDINCPTLSGKPRIIILNTCRGNFKDKEMVTKKLDRGVIVNVQVQNPSITGSREVAGRPDVTNTHDDPSELSGRFRVETVEDNTLQHVALGKLPQHYLLVYPVVSGQTARRNEKDGSWLIHGIKKIAEEKYISSDQLHKPINFLKLLTEVSGYIARERESVIYKERKQGQSQRENQENQLEDVEQNQSQNNQSDWVRDEEKSGFKTAVCFHHRLTEPIMFYPEQKEPELPQTAPFTSV